MTLRKAAPYVPLAEQGLTMRDLRYRVRGRAALDRLRNTVDESKGADLSALLAKLEALSPEEGP